MQTKMKQAILALLVLVSTSAFSQIKYSKNELSINAFRNPSIGLEYRHQKLSVHAGYYTTAFNPNEFTNFIKAGFTYWFLPADKKEIPSSFYAGASYLRGLTRDYKDANAVALEAGYRFMIWKGLNLRIGVIALSAKDQSIKINPTPGISYSISF